MRMQSCRESTQPYQRDKVLKYAHIVNDLLALQANSCIAASSRSRRPVCPTIPQQDWKRLGPSFEPLATVWQVSHKVRSRASRCLAGALSTRLAGRAHTFRSRSPAFLPNARHLCVPTPEHVLNPCASASKRGCPTRHDGRCSWLV